MLLYEVGLYPDCSFCLVRQIPNDDEEYCQLHLELHFEVTEANKSLSECKWHEKLMDYYFDKSNPLFTIFMDKTIFDKAWRHIEYVHKLKDFRHLHERQAVSVLMFVYINLLLEFIQKELAAEAAS